MSGKRLLFIPTVLAVTAAPYFVFEDGWTTGAKTKWQSLIGSSDSDGEAVDPAAVAFVGDGSLPGASAGETPPQAAPAPQLAGGRVTDLREVFRFDITPGWVTARWSRVSTTLADLELEGFRVPLVTGTGPQDLAGSLTYYFDKHGVVQRIAFHGFTGDDRPLVALATQYFAMRSEPALGTGLYLAKWNGKPTSALKVGRASVVRADSPRSQLYVAMEINRPAVGYQLSPAFQQVLKREQT
jgi:hypothetical protein